MSLLENFKKIGGYKISVKCPNCGFGSMVKVPKGTSVTDFVKGGKCKCDNCAVVFYPEEYTTEHFEKDKNKDMKIVLKPGKKEVSFDRKEKPDKRKGMGEVKEPNYWGIGDDGIRN